MAFNIVLPLPKGWESSQEITEEPEGDVVTHFEAFLPNDKAQTDEAAIDLYVGPMPPETSAQDEALANYADMIGWEEDDDDDPLTEWPFQNRKAYGFEGECDDSSLIRVMCIEIRKGVLMVMSVVALTDNILADTVTYIEKNFKIE